jgi:hypothetical protein
MDPVSSGMLAELSRDVRDRFQEGQSGFSLLPKNEEAMMWRLALIDSLRSNMWLGQETDQIANSIGKPAAGRVRVLVFPKIPCIHDFSLKNVAV